MVPGIPPPGHGLRSTFPAQRSATAPAVFLTRSRRRPIRFIAPILAALTLAATAHADQGSQQRNAAIIQQVFGRYGPQAVQVARCESGLSVYATNGQYLGLFQMGAYARARFGHGWNAWVQARAAYAYFRASGYGWGPWACKPW